MDNSSVTVTERLNVNGSTRRSSPVPVMSPAGRPTSLMDTQSTLHVVQVVVNRDERGYGMKVSGDNPVYVQSVKEGGAAEKAGLHAGDKIIKVNDVNVITSKHTDVVDLIRSSKQVVLTVQQRTRSQKIMGSPSLHNRPVTTPSNTRITGPQPVDHEKQYQLQLEKEQHYRLMIEKEQRYVDLLRSQLVSSPDEKKLSELMKTEKNLQTLQSMLQRSQSESPNPTHHRTKSSPESLSTLSLADASRKLIASESMNDLRPDGWERAETPPGTPPPPYPSPPSSRRRPYNSTENGESTFEETTADCSSPEASPFRMGNANRVLANCSPIHAATPSTTQQPIISMEDDEISDQDTGPLEDHGPFQALSKLWESLPHLAVFMNYVLSNSDPNSLLFYLLTDLYKEGNAKEMRKWAFEIHSCFLVPGAPLRLSNVDENIAHEIDDDLIRDFDKEEILRKTFFKARIRAKEELTKQLVDFQQKRIAGLGTIFGPTDQNLLKIYNDKAKETKLYESLFLEKLEPYLEEIDKENYDPKRYYTAAALTTVLARVFGLRPNLHTIDRCPTFISKEKSFRTKLIGRYSRKLNVQGHTYVAQQYYTVIVCNNCHQIIYGIGPQGYRCSECRINLHRHCVNLYDDTCPGPINKKDRGLGKILRMRHENEHRRKHSSYFAQEKRATEEKDASFELNESGESKPSQPVSRSGSDRRPDVVREEISKSTDGNTNTDSHGHHKQDSDVSTPESSASFPSAVHRKKGGSNINRSESVKEQTEKRKQRRNISDPSHNTTSGELELDHQGLSNTDSGSSSNSSISYNGRLSESPSNSVDIVTADGAQSNRKASTDWESDADMEPTSWQKLFPEEELRNLQPYEKKRQDVINELFHTEYNHVQNLKVLYKIFYQTLLDSQTLKADELTLIFPNIKEMLNVHVQLNKEMRRKRREDPLVSNLGDMVVSMFGGSTGETLQKAAAVFCERQQLALEFIKDRRRRDSKFDSILLECEKKHECRRLPLQGFIPTEMQRLSKYPLLLERLINSMEADTSNPNTQEELTKLRKAHNSSKEILNYVNEAAKLALNRARLEDIQRHLDTTNFERSDHPIAQEFRTLDLTRYKLIIEGNMQLRRPNKGLVPVHILLLEEAVIILHKEGDRFLLKFFQSGSSAQPAPLSPIIKMSTLLVRNNAVCKNALFLVNTSTNNSQMYDLIADDDMKRDMWFKHFSDASDAHNRREGKTKRPEPQPDSDESETVQELPSTRDVAERAEAIGGGDENAPEEEDDDDQVFSDAQEDERPTDNQDGAASSEGGGVQTRITADEWPLIQPSQVHVEVPPVHIAESRLTPLEQIRRKDEEVRRALQDKEGLVADLLNIPREHFHLIADMAGDTPESRPSKDLEELVVAAIYQVDQLHLIVNESLNVTEASAISATGGKLPACQSQEVSGSPPPPPSIPAHSVGDIANLLSSQLTTLLNVVKQMGEERDRIRKENFRLRERLHEDHLLHGPSEEATSSSPPPEPQPDLDSIKESPTESES